MPRWRKWRAEWVEVVSSLERKFSSEEVKGVLVVTVETRGSTHTNVRPCLLRVPDLVVFIRFF